MSGMKVTFHGAAGMVTGSCTLVECDGSRVLFDCGMIQGDENAAELNRADFPFDPAGLDAVDQHHGEAGARELARGGEADHAGADHQRIHCAFSHLRPPRRPG